MVSRSFIGVLLLCTLSFPSIALAQVPSHAWLDVNGTVTNRQQDPQTYRGTSQPILPPVTYTIALMDTDYPELPNSGGFDIDGGVTLSRYGFGVGARFAQARYHYDVALDLTVVPDGLLANLKRDSEPTPNRLQRTESAVDLMATWTAPWTGSRIRLRAFGGPTYFYVSQAMVSNIQYDQAVNGSGVLTSVEITGTSQVDADGSGWGYNVGLEGAYFFSPHVGFGGVIRFSRTDVDVPVPLPNTVNRPAALTVGGTTVGGGIRFRF